MARGTGECPIYKRKRKRADGTEYPIYAFDLVMSNGEKKTYYSHVGEKKGDFQKRKNQIMIENQRTVRVSKSFITVKQLLLNWMAQKRDIENSTKTTYTYAINNYVIPIIGDLQVQKITKDDMDKLITYLQVHGGISTKDEQVKHLKPLKPSSLKKIKFILKLAFDYAIEKDYLLKNPTNKLILPKVVKPPIKPFTKDEVQKLLDTAKETSMYIPILLDLSTGLRRGELLGLQWKDINFETGVLTVSRQLVPISSGVEIKDSLKTNGSKRQVGIPPFTLAELQKHKENIDSRKANDNTFVDTGIHQDLVIRVSNGKCYHPRNFARKFDLILKKAGIEKRRINDMRHTFATLLLSSGAYVTEVQASLGHTDAKTTLGNYSHVLPDGHKELAAKMNSIIDNESTPTEAPVSVADELMKLSELMKSGVLTEDEFNQQKQMLLGNINAEKPSN